MYYNTHSHTGTKLAKKHRKDESQRAKVFNLFKLCRRLSPWQVYVLYNYVNNGNIITDPSAAAARIQLWDLKMYKLAESKWDKITPITSIRRCISDLTTEGLLIKTDSKVNGREGDPEFIWSIK